MKNIKLFEEFINELKNVNAETISDLLSTYFILHKGNFYFFDCSKDDFIESFQNFLKDNNLPQVENDFDAVTNYIEKGFIEKLDYISGHFRENMFNKNIPKGSVVLEIFNKEFNDVKYSDEINKILKHFSTLNYIEFYDTIYTREELLKFKFNTDFKLGEFVYHGTSLDNIKGILKYGLKANSDDTTSLFKDRSKDMVHFTTTFNMAKYYSKINKLKNFNSKNRAVIIEISTKNLNKNLIDYDYKFYQKFIEDETVNINKTSNLNKFGYKGIIYPSKINKIFVDNGNNYDEYSIEEIKNII